jgi:hypothetical protein
MKREHWRIELRIYARLAKPLRLMGVDLNWVFDPLTQIRRAIARKGAPVHPVEVGQNRHEE